MFKAECQWPSTLTAKVSANQRGIEQGILWGVDIQLNGLMFTWILFTLCPESGGMTPQGGPGVTAGAIFQLLKHIVYRIPTLPCPHVWLTLLLDLIIVSCCLINCPHPNYNLLESAFHVWQTFSPQQSAGKWSRVYVVTIDNIWE